jgi:hypothetical protein
MVNLKHNYLLAVYCDLLVALEQNFESGDMNFYVVNSLVMIVSVVKNARMMNHYSLWVMKVVAFVNNHRLLLFQQSLFFQNCCIYVEEIDYMIYYDQSAFDYAKRRPFFSNILPMKK